MQRYHNNVQDSEGNAQSGVTVTVRRVSDGGLANIFSDNSGTSKSNPFTNDSDGEFFFYAANARYNVFFTGPITDQIDDVLLYDPDAQTVSLKLRTDIVTATPPVTELVTGNFEIWDADGSDQLAQFGFNAGNTLRVVNRFHGGIIQINGENASGTPRTMIQCDTDVDTRLYHAADSAIALATISGGIEVRSVGNTDAEGRYIRLARQDGTDRALIGHTADTTLTLRNQIHGGNTTLTAENNSGTVRTLVSGDPDASVSIYHPASALIRMTTNTTGRMNINSDGSTDTEQRSLNFCHQDQTVRGSLGHVTADEFILRNLIHGGNIQMQIEDAVGNARQIFNADPDGVTILRGDTDVEIRVAMTGTTASELAIDCTANGAVTLYYNNGASLQTRVDNATMTTAAQVKHADGSFYDIGLTRMPITELDVNSDLNIDNQHKFIHKDAGGAVTFELQNDSNIPTGCMWMISNEDVEDITIDATTNTCTLRWFDGGGVTPPTGNRTLAEAGVCTIIKYGVAEYFIWGIGLS